MPAVGLGVLMLSLWGQRHIKKEFSSRCRDTRGWVSSIIFKELSGTGRWQSPATD